MTTSLTQDEKPVFFSHAPKTAGTSLRHLLETPAQTHAMPIHVMSEKLWNHAFIIAAVRHPFDRFLSGFAYYVQGKYRGVLYRAHGEPFKSLDQFEFLEFIQQYPEKFGLMSQWTHYPSATKPCADLILKVEESEKWIDQIQSAGIDLGGRTLKQLNATEPATLGTGKLAGLTEDAVERLHDLVYNSFRTDYENFGYHR